MRQGTTDAVPLCSLVSEHAEVGIAYVIYHVIRCGHVEAITEPIDCHLSRCHGVKHEILQVLQGLGIGKECFVHVYTIQEMGDNSTDAVPPCQLSGAADQFVSLNREILTDSITQNAG